MADLTLSPNMFLPVPNVSEAPGPDWATDLNACLSILDGHDHSSGSGVQITPSGLNINADLPFGGNAASGLGNVQFTAGSLLSVLDSLYVNGVDLWFTDGAGNQVRITQSGSVTGATGTITGLPSGTASASYSAGFYTFQSATNTPANMNVGPLIIGRNVAGSKTVTITPNATQAADYGITLPAEDDAGGLANDGSGNLSWSLGFIPLGGVISTFPNLSGAYNCIATTAADANGFVLCNGQTIIDATSPLNGQTIPNLNNNNFIRGNTTAGGTGGNSQINLNHNHKFKHTHIHLNHDSLASGLDLSCYKSSDPNQSVFSPASSGYVTIAERVNGSLNAGATPFYRGFAIGTDSDNEPLYTTGVVDPPEGSSGADARTESTLSSTQSILPPYVNAVYVMRIK